MISEPAGAFYPLPRAAQLLGVSIVTLRRRIKAGAVQAHQVDTRHGRAWEVWVDQPARLSILPPISDEGNADQQGGYAQGREQGAQRGRDQSSGGDQPLLKALDLLDQVLSENRALRGQLAAAEERIHALETPRDVSLGNPHQRTPDGPQTAEGPGGVSVVPRRPWWRFW